MDDTRFDALARSLTESRSRRNLTRVLGGFALAGWSSLLGLSGTVAKKKGKKKKKKKKGPCGNGCSGGTLCCGDRCVSVLTDRNNCGACGKQCGVTELCLNAQCAPCEDPMALCSVAGEQKCVDVRTDPSNCGACGNVCAKDPEIASRDEVCVDRQCDCPPGGARCQNNRCCPASHRECIGDGAGCCTTDFPVSCPGGICCPASFPNCGGSCGQNCCQ